MGAGRLFSLEELSGLAHACISRDESLIRARRLGEGEHVAVSPVVEYRVNGVRHEFTGNYYNTGMQIGDKVKVLYRPEDPSSATMKGAAFLAPLITGAVSVTFIIIGVVYLMIAG